MLTIRTASGSIYEVDEPNRMIRCRARCTIGGSRRLPPGGPWVDYAALLFGDVGSCMYVGFSDTDADVVTSRVVEVVALSISDAI